MNNLNNKVQLIGRIGTDIDSKTFDSGNKKVSFRMATTEVRKDADGNKQEETQWHNIIAWGKLAEILEKYTKKGDELMLEGKLVYRMWETKEGEKKYFTEIETRDLRLMGGVKGQIETDNSAVKVEIHTGAEVNDGLPF
jgi:single-strand DNA-binding protein